jgi:hypothetical protein
MQEGRQMSPRLENLLSWLVASAVVTAGVLFAVKRQEEQQVRKPVRVLRRATPAQEPLGLQEIRATERGRGRSARSPSQIPWRGWKDILLRTYQETQDDRLLSLAAGVVFYSLVALFPAIGAGVSFYALFADAGTMGKHLSLAAGIVPTDVLDILREEITRIGAKSDGRLTLGFLLGLGIALWSANAGMKAIFDALNIIYDEQERRGLIRLNLISLFFTVCGIGAALWWYSRFCWRHSASPLWMSRSSVICAGPRWASSSSSVLPCSIAMVQAAARQNGAGSTSAASLPPRLGW